MVKKAKKVTKRRGVKPGTKLGRYKVAKPRNKPMTIADFAKEVKNWQVVEEENPYTPAQPLTLCGQLEDAILLLENRISNAIAKINSLM